MMRCPHCEAEVSREAKFCNVCGNLLPVPIREQAKPVVRRSEGQPQAGNRPAQNFPPALPPDAQRAGPPASPGNYPSVPPAPPPYAGNVPPFAPAYGNPQDVGAYPASQGAGAYAYPPPQGPPRAYLAPQGPGVYPPPQGPSAPYGTVPRSTKPRKRGRPIVFGCLGLFLVALLVVAVLRLFVPSKPQPQISLIAGQAQPGKVITLKGENFPAQSRISVVVDDQPLLAFQHTSMLSISTMLLPTRVANSQGRVYRALVGNDGTFTVKMKIPAEWKAGTKHVVVAQVVGTNPQHVKPLEYPLNIL